MRIPGDDFLAAILRDRLPFFSTLVKTPSTRGNEERAQMLMLAELKALGLETEIVSTEALKHCAHTTASPSIAGRLRGKGSGRSLILNCHMDTAPAGPRELWLRDPFSGELIDGVMHGRGAWDDKAGAIAILMVLDFLKQKGITLDGDLVVESVVEDEYSGCGTLSLIRKGIKADAAVIVDGHYGTRYANGHPGHLEFIVTLYGKPAPSCRVEAGISAIQKACELMVFLQQWSGKLAGKGEAAWRKACEGSLLNIGRISGGEWVGTVPQKCSIDCLVRFPPPLSILDVRSSLEELMREICRSDHWLNESPPVIEYGDLSLEPVLIENEGLFFPILQDSIAGIMKNSSEAHICPGWCDLRHFSQEAGIPACLFGPGRGQGAHRPDESFETAQLIPHVKVLLEVIRQWCTADQEAWVA